MIRTLTGTVREARDGNIILEVYGVGYLVACPTILCPPLRSTVTLFTYLAVRETALDLYGFQTTEEREMFELLLGTPKVGPKSALQILNQASPQLLIEAAQKNDPSYLQKLSGIGKKTCENLIQHLSNKLESLPIHTEITTTTDPVQTDAIDALISLGYDQATARETIQSLATPDATVNSLITKALKQIT